MTAALRFIKGARSLTLRDDRFTFERGFTPPATHVERQIAAGTALTPMGGALVSSHAVNRDWSFDIGFKETSILAVRRAQRDIQSFLSEAGDEQEPLLIEYSPAGLPAPLWGQLTAPLRYEIVSGDVEMQRSGGLAWNHLPLAQINLQIKPWASGLTQRCASAIGGVYYEKVGVPNQGRRGLVVAEATTNLVTNPTFGSSTFDNDWSDAYGVLAANIDPAYTYPDEGVSARFIANDILNLGTLTQTITASGTHTLSLYVMLPDLSTPDITHHRIIFDGAEVDPVISAVGEGIYKLTYSASASGAATTYGIGLWPGYSIYLLGAQLEAKAYDTPLCAGHFIGCAWSAAAHDSSSTRAVGRVLALIEGQQVDGAIVLAWKPRWSSTHPTDQVLFSDAGGDLKAWYNATQDRIYFTAGIGGPYTEVLTFAAGDVLRLAFVWSTAGILIYLNGVLAASQVGSYLPSVPDQQMYLMSNDAPALQAGGELLRWSIFAQPLTAEQVANDDAFMAALTDDDFSAESIPYLWTKDGNDQIDNSDDSTHDNWALVDGVPGTAPARSLIEFTYASAGTEPLVWLAQHDLEHFIEPESAGLTYGGSEVLSINTSEVEFTTAQRAVDNRLLVGGDAYVLLRITDAGANLIGKVRVKYSGVTYDSDFVTLAADATARLFLFGPIPIKPVDALYDWVETIGLCPVMKRSSAGAANVTIDYVLVTAFDSLKIVSPSGIMAGTILVDGIQAVSRTATAGYYMGVNYKLNEFLTTTGAAIELTPQRPNLLMAARGALGAAFSLTKLIDLVVTVTPRYHLL